MPEIPPAYQWYPKDILSSAKVQRMSLEAEGAYRRLLDYQWLNGSIPQSLGELARLCKGITKGRMLKLWDEISDCFITTADGSGFINLKLEIVRNSQKIFREERSRSGKKGAEVKWNQQRGHGSAIKEPIAKNSSSSASSSAYIGEEVKNTSSPSSSPQKPDSHRPRDLAFDLFAEAHQEALDALYVPNEGDFVLLTKLRKAYKTLNRGSPPHWPEAVKNYFSSPLGKYSLSDLCSRFATFRNGPVDRYNKLGGQSGSAGQQTARNGDELMREMAERTKRDS